MSTYPRVVGEDATIDEVVKRNASIARYGDGEFNLIKGGNCVSQIADPGIRKELIGILTSQNTDCLVGIPNMTKESPKAANWLPRASTYSKHLDPKKLYFSSFVTRPDSAPWVNNKQYFDKIEALWAHQQVILVHCGERSLSPSLMSSAESVYSVICPRRDAYRVIDELMLQTVKLCDITGISRVFLCAGPTATCMAHRLSLAGIQGLDLGHIGSYWRRYEHA
jgi:hypothetical protein